LVAALLCCAVGAEAGGTQPDRPAFSLPTPSRPFAAMIAASGKVVAAICQDHSLVIWSLPDRRVLQTLTIPGREYTAAAISGDGRWLAFGDYHGGLTIWDTTTGKSVVDQQAEPYLLAAAFSHNNQLLAIAPGNQPVRIIDVASGRPVSALDRAAVVTTSIAFSRDDARIATADGDAVRVYDRRTGRLLSENMDFTSEAFAVDFGSGADQIVASTGDKTILLIDGGTGKTRARTKKAQEPIFYLSVSPDGRQVAAVTLKADNLQAPAPVSVWNFAPLQRTVEWMARESVMPPAVWTADGRLFVATAAAEALHLWQIH
jgi:WD40 repeat protein